jgi:hypothetical protein
MKTVKDMFIGTIDAVELTEREKNNAMCHSDNDPYFNLFEKDMALCAKANRCHEYATGAKAFFASLINLDLANA